MIWCRKGTSVNRPLPLDEIDEEIEFISARDGRSKWSLSQYSHNWKKKMWLEKSSHSNTEIEL